MPKVQKNVDFLQRLAELEDTVAALQRAGWERDELPFYPTSLHTFVYEDSTSFATLWETILSPRTAQLSLGLVFIGDQVSSVNTGGEWQVVFNDSTVVASGTVQIQVRRTSGTNTGGKFGGGGSIGGAPRYARLL